MKSTWLIILTDFNYEKWKHRKSWEFSWRILEKKGHQPIRFKPNVNKHSEKWQPTTWKQLFIYPVGLTKTLSRIEYGSTTNSNSIKKISTNNNNKISTNSHQKVFRNIHRKRPVSKSLFNKVSGLRRAALSKKTPTHVFSY